MRIKRECLIALAITGSVFLIACGKTSNSPDSHTVSPNSSATASPTASATASATTSTAAESDSPASDTNESSEEKDLPIYSINDDSLEKEDTTATVTCEDGKVTARVVVDAVVEDFQNHSIEIGIDKVTEKGNTVYVSFQSGTAPLANVGAGVESTILDCISQSLLDNLDSCSRVVFQAEGQAYCSGHYEFGKEEAYIEK
ncbi:MAG: GerMN domain-containing protein [Clostridiales bacterium]|nr:GerMN domain-containing protein [Clostridiales bacterium]